MRKSIQPDKIEKIKIKFPELNIRWLLTGEGEMYETPNGDAQKTEPPAAIPLIPIHAMGGSLSEFASSARLMGCEMVVSPIRGADYVIGVSGDSMAPEYPSGSKVVVKRINERAFIDWGRVYVLDTCNGAVIKKIMPGSGPDYVRCVSLNPDYPDFEVAFTDMYGMYRVLMMMCEK